MSKKAIQTPSGPALAGVRVLVGRARHQAEALSEQLRKLGADVIAIPFIEIRRPRSFAPLNAALRSLNSYDWLILTSVNGVEAMWERLTKLELPTSSFQSLRIAAIGPATKKAIEQHGMKVNVVPEEYVAESVVRGLRDKVIGKRVLLIRAKVARDVIPKELRETAARVDVVEAYETVLPRTSRSRLRRIFSDPQLRPHVITFTSSSTVRNFVSLLGGPRAAARVLSAGRTQALPDSTDRPPSQRAPHRSELASIGPVTSSTLREFGLPVNIEAAEFTVPGLIRAIVRSRPPRR